MNYGHSLLDALLARYEGAEQPHIYVRDLPGRDAITDRWPEWVLPSCRAFLESFGVMEPYVHQVATADLAWQGQHVVVSTGTASGKTLCYHMPVVTALARDPLATALYFCPTKALTADQLRTFTQLLEGTREAADSAHEAETVRHLDSIAPATYDGDTDYDTRAWIRDNSRFVLTNPDMLHLSLLGQHHSWARFLRQLRFIIVDECHAYRGVFGSNVAIEMRRLLRLARHYGANPTVILASATTSNPEIAASRLIGEPVQAVTRDGSPQGERTMVLWQPPVLPGIDTQGDDDVRMSANTQASHLLTDLVAEGARTLCFIRSRHAAEVVAVHAAQELRDLAAAGRAPVDASERIAAYRAGYLASDRRELERHLNDGTLLAAATTNALELGIDIAGLDAVIMAGFPGTVASFWQQAGRAGRRNQGALVVMVATANPLNTYLIAHPEALLDTPVEATITNPANENLLVPQLLCALAETPLTDTEAAQWGKRDGLNLERLLGEMEQARMVRHRLNPRLRTSANPTGGAWFPAGQYADCWKQVQLRGGSADNISIVCVDDGRLLGTTDTARACSHLFPQAIYLHQGEAYLVEELDFENSLALVTMDAPPWLTYSSASTEVDIVEVREDFTVGDGPRLITVGLADVVVREQVTSFQRRSLDGTLLSSEALEMPPTELLTQSVFYCLQPEFFAEFDIPEADIPGALHAAEHAAIGLLPLLADCDRGDIGGLSIALHPGTQLPTVFVYDGYEGGAGYAQRGFHTIRHWLQVTAETIEACPCESGCPSCIHSPKCGNGNNPLSKEGAVKLLRGVLTQLPADTDRYSVPSAPVGAMRPAVA